VLIKYITLKQTYNIHLKYSANSDIIKSEKKMSAHKTFILMQLYGLECYRWISLEIFCTSHKASYIHVTWLIFFFPPPISHEKCIKTQEISDS